MKYIEKKPSNEPSTLKNYRETTPDAKYSGFIDSEHLLKIALLEEQGHLCAYCMKRISLKRSSLGRDEKTAKPMVEVEHYFSQDEFPEKDLDYSNMLGVCNGYSQGEMQCDKSKAELRLKILNPLDKEVESYFNYSIDDSVLPLKNEEEVKPDIALLNLNNKNLIKARKEAVDIARVKLIEKNPVKQWTKALIEKEIEDWSRRYKKGEDYQYRPFCMIAIWFLNDLKKRNRYPAK
jgi:uncharacterized protein (TIGR02646 family)